MYRSSLERNDTIDLRKEITTSYFLKLVRKKTKAEQTMNNTL